MRLKDGVTLAPEMLMLFVAMQEVERAGAEFVITSGTDGKHMKGSMHYVGKAIDFRSRTMAPVAIENCARAIRRRLGTDFDLVIEPTHFHLEHDQK